LCWANLCDDNFPEKYRAEAAIGILATQMCGVISVLTHPSTGVSKQPKCKSLLVSVPGTDLSGFLSGISFLISETPIIEMLLKQEK
jgi:hypothetical protein